MNKYDDIKHLSRPQYDDLHPMSMSDRAAQFSPFAALVGYDAAVTETARLVDTRSQLTEDDIDQLNSELNRLLDILDQQPLITITYFVPDERKDGGKYTDKTGIVRIYDNYTNELVFMDGDRIAISDMYRINIQKEK